MSVRSTHLLPRAAGLALLALAACDRDSPVDPAPAPPPALSSAAPTAPDRLDPMELPAGTESAFGFPLPRHMVVTFRGPFEVRAEGTIDADLVANYVRKRMKSDGVEVGAARTIFAQARLRDAPQAHVCRVEVISVGTTTQLIIRDLTPERYDPSLTPEERWKNYGLGPDGRLLDPKHME